MTNPIEPPGTGRRALVTGASRGIGQAVAEALLKQGFFVHGTYVTSGERAAALEAEHSELRMHRVDCSEPAQVDALVAELSDAPLHALVNNAGIFETEVFDDFDMALWRRVFEANLHAPVRLVTGLAPVLTPGAAVVNVASLDGLRGSFASSAYSASKAALVNVTRSLANNLASRSIRVNAVAPGWIDTSMATPESALAAGLTPLGRNGSAGEVGSVIEFLLGAGSAFVTGETIVVDGGYGNVDYVMLQEART